MVKLLIGAAVVATVIIGIVFVININKDSPRPKNDSAFNDTSEEPSVKIKGLGINLDYYDPKTNSAGDIKFTDHKFSYKPPFDAYGHFKTGLSTDEGPERNPQPSFFVPRGTKIRALIDGFVYDVPKLYSGDYSVIIAPSMDSRWRFETEHVNNPIVKPGDFVKAGQVVAEASTAKMGNDMEWGWFEIGIGKGSQNTTDRPQHVCPFKYLNDSIKDETLKKLKALMLSWEQYRKDPNFYDENSTSIPGCLVLDTLDG